MRMDAGLDTGPMLAAASRLRSLTTTMRQSLHDKLARWAATWCAARARSDRCGLACAKRRSRRQASPTRAKIQDDEAVTRLVTDRRCRSSAAVRALRPAPGARTQLRGEADARSGGARVAQRAQGTRHRCIAAAPTAIRVACGDDALDDSGAAARQAARAFLPANSCAACPIAAGERLAPLADALARGRDQVAQVAAGHAACRQSSSAARTNTPRAARAALVDLCYGTLRRYGRVARRSCGCFRARAGHEPAGRGAAVVRALRARIRQLRRVHGGRPGGARLRSAG